MPIYQLADARPSIHPDSYVHPDSTLIGSVELAANSSIWPGAVLRADNDTIAIGENSNIQDNAVIHVDGGYPVLVAANVTVGHQAMLHGCRIGEGSLIGIGTIILNDAQIGKNSIVAAGALVTEGKSFPDNSLIVGTPAKVMRELTDSDTAFLEAGVQHYVDKAKQFAQQLVRLDNI